jgi:hypothetical protein
MDEDQCDHNPMGTSPANQSSVPPEGAKLAGSRPLFIDNGGSNEMVGQFAKKHPAEFNHFIEAISMLAYDIAWFSRSQGFVQGTEKWEDICDIGRILYDMFYSSARTSTAPRAMSQRQTKDRPSGAASSSTAQPDNLPVGRLGSGSHTSAHTPLNSATSPNETRNWQISEYNVIFDPLKDHLINEMNNAEWELLDEQEFDDGGERMDEAVMIKARGMDDTAFGEARSVMTAATGANAVDEGEEDVVGKGKGKAKGTSGWTKVKSREKP